MKDKVMPEPSGADWIRIADEFENRANFPNCIGALDGKHVRLVKPDHSGSQFYNYKNYCSLVLLGVADVNYCFITIDVGPYGKSADSNIFKQSLLNKKLCSGSLDIPDKRPLRNFNSNTPMPFTIVADEAFAMSENVMRPYAKKDLDNKKRIFNYRLTRARRLIECTFGILANKWRIFHTAAIHLDPDFATMIVLTTCVLHNFVRLRDGFKFEDTLTCAMVDIPVIGTGGTGKSAKQVRDTLAEFFITPAGSVPWQYHKVNSF
nr:unnamed protein product [Callosobruchus analis]